MTGRLEACIRLAEKVGIKNKRNSEKAKAAQRQVPNAKIKQGYADKLEFATASMDLVTLF